ncbi:UPF0193 protein EVG1 homolog [Xenia sp. Carnegie-2017]|uniref:UPF0193 protein EVG1 homolog n=1 Tax=Xenia sp. Carnegie-2017 TaxID=2897299 RepID=UPI001F04ABC6|nr:UPF0193 protein EVG1 homolog [Xenia sp. Carnegie-2017]
MALRPRQPVAKGGLMAPSRHPVSKETQDLLKVMMQESKLTNFQRRQLNERLREGESFPTNVNPTTSARKEQANASKTAGTTKNVNHKSLNGGKRTQAEILRRKEFDDDEPYRPLPGKCITEKDKRILQNKMSYGDEGAALIEQTPQPQNISRGGRLEPEIDRFDEVVELIEERKQFLDDMEKLGQGKKYRSLIAAEISKGIRELELIDKKRTEELNLALENDTSSTKKRTEELNLALENDTSSNTT